MLNNCNTMDNNTHAGIVAGLNNEVSGNDADYPHPHHLAGLNNEVSGNNADYSYSLHLAVFNNEVSGNSADTPPLSSCMVKQ